MALPLKVAGGIATLATLAFMVLVAAAQIGVVSAYPAPPVEAVEIPGFGRSADLPFEALDRRAGESDEAFKRRLVESVNAYMIHYWPVEDRRYVGVSPLDNYPMWLKSFVPDYPHFANYEFVTPRMAWRRGYGFCSQVSRIVYSVLRDNGIPATIMQHPNHVVVESDDYVLDADYGVTIPHSLRELQANPSLIKPYYSAHDAMIPTLMNIYADGWTPTADDAAFDYMRGFEQSAANWIWPPLLLLLWMSVAITDAGFCWPRFFVWARRLPPYIYRGLHLRDTSFR